jgi:hypothetical protein
MRNNNSDVNLLQTALEVYLKISCMAIDESLYDTIMYGDSIGSPQYALELSMCLQEQNVIMEILDGI